MLKNLKKIIIVDNGIVFFQEMEKKLKDMTGYEIVWMTNDSDALIKALNDEEVVMIIHDLKQNTIDLQPIVDNLKYNSIEKKMDGLSKLEHKIMVSLDKGLLYKEIAISFNLTLGTLKQYTHILYKKLGVSNRTEAINKYFNRK